MNKIMSGCYIPSDFYSHHVTVEYKSSDEFKIFLLSLNLYTVNVAIPGSKVGINSGDLLSSYFCQRHMHTFYTY